MSERCRTLLKISEKTSTISSKISLVDLWQLWTRASCKWPRCWRQVRGPLGAAWLTLRRFGWSWVDPVRVQTDLGATICLTEFSPKAIEDALNCAGMRRAERAFASHLRNKGQYDDECGQPVDEQICVAAAAKLVRARSKPLAPLNRGCLESVVSGAL